MSLAEEMGMVKALRGLGEPHLQKLAAIVDLEAAWGRDALVAALERAHTFRRFRASDVRSILEAGVGVVPPNLASVASDDVRRRSAASGAHVLL